MFRACYFIRQSCVFRSLFFIADPGRLESRHVPQDIVGGVDQVEGKGRAGPFADAHFELQQRLFPELFQQIPVADLRRTVPRDQVIADSRYQRIRDGRGGWHD